MDVHPVNDSELTSTAKPTTQTSSTHLISLQNTSVTNSGSNSHNMDNGDSNEATTPVSRGQQRSTVFSSVLSSGPTSSLAATSVRATAANSRQVRQNWWGYIVENFRSISRTSKVLLILNLIVVIIQVFTIFYLSITNN